MSPLALELPGGKIYRGPHVDNWGPSTQADQVIHQLPGYIKERDVEVGGEGRKGGGGSERGREEGKENIGKLSNSFSQVPLGCGV